MARQKRAKWRSYLDRYPIDIIASFAGVSVGTVRRWKRDGIPSARVASTQALHREVRPPSRKRLKAVLGALQPQEIAKLIELHGDNPPSLKTISRWKEIPLRYQGAWFGPTHTAVATFKATPVKPFVETKQFKTAELVINRWEVKGILSEEMNADLMIITSKTGTELTNSSFQFMVKGKASLVHSNEYTLKYILNEVEIKTGDDRAPIERYFRQFNNLADARADLIDELAVLTSESFEIESISLICWDYDGALE